MWPFYVSSNLSVGRPLDLDLVREWDDLSLSGELEVRLVVPAGLRGSLVG